MSDIRWDILQPVDIGGRFQQGYDHAQQNALQQQERAYQLRERQRTEGLRNALTGAVSPTTGEIDYGAARRAYLGAGDVQGAIGVDTSRRTQATAERDLRIHDIRIGARAIRQVNPTDQASWERALAAAHQLGANIEGAPATFDPNYVQQLLAAADAAADPSQGFTLGEGDVRYGEDGRVIARGAPRRAHYIPIPPGGHLELDPNDVGAPPTSLPHAATPADIAHLPPGSQFIAPDGTVRTVPGGAPQPQAASTFP